MRVLGIETSCDETSASVVDNGRILSNVVVSQIDVHSKYGGVVPELASRKHIEAISLVIDQALEQSGAGLEIIEGFAVTRGPGLIGALLVGMGAAKGLALARKAPLVGVNHLHGHLFSAQLEHKDIGYPFIGLVVSGGHTTIFEVSGPFEIERIGATRDDAAGEAFDKVAKLLGLGYPGGRVIEERASKSINRSLKFPRALLKDDAFDFSFSGLKTAVLKHVEQAFGVSIDSRPGSFHPVDRSAQTAERQTQIDDICYAFQESVIEVLATKVVLAAKTRNIPKIVVSGGVAANNALRNHLIERSQSEGLKIVFPSVKLCSDNAAMIAHRGETLLKAGIKDDLSMDARSRWQ